MLYDAGQLGENAKFYKIYDNDGNLLKYVKSCDPVEGYYNEFVVGTDGKIERISSEDGVFGLKMVQKFDKFKLVDTRSGEEITK